ncbi:MAG: cytochrome c-type biogenesis protein, partial [bacterium]
MTARKPGARLTAAAAALLLLAAVSAAARADTLDDRVYAIASQLMCPVCAGQTVAESDSAVAREMRDVIRTKLLAGETPDAILKFFVGQFGESVLAEPPRHGLSLLLYLGPAAGVAGG